MHVFRRIKETLSVNVESLLDQVENHEATAAAKLRDMERGAQRVRTHRSRCERELQAHEARIESLEKQSEQWRNRARQCADNRQQALECVRRLQMTQRTCEQTRRQAAHKRAQLEQIAQDEQAIDAKLHELRGRHAELACRHVRSEVEQEGTDVHGIEDIFDRWEARVGAPANSSASVPDAFERSFTEQEEQQNLHALLDEVLNESEESR